MYEDSRERIKVEVFRIHTHYFIKKAFIETTNPQRKITFIHSYIFDLFNASYCKLTEVGLCFSKHHGNVMQPPVRIYITKHFSPFMRRTPYFSRKQQKAHFPLFTSHNVKVTIKKKKTPRILYLQKASYHVNTFLSRVNMKLLHQIAEFKLISGSLKCLIVTST